MRCWLSNKMSRKTSCSSTASLVKRYSCIKAGELIESEVINRRATILWARAIKRTFFGKHTGILIRVSVNLRPQRNNTYQR